MNIKEKSDVKNNLVEYLYIYNDISLCTTSLDNHLVKI